MNDDDSALGSLLLVFAVLSVFTIGGVNASMPEMHRQVVEVRGWLSDQRFTDLFAIAQAAPGPNVIIAALIGYQVAGLAGGFVATVALVGPTSVLAYSIGHIWHRFRHAPLRIAIQAGVTPISIGLVASSAYVLALANDKSVVAVIVTLVSALGIYRTRLHPLIFLAVGGVLGALGLL